MCCKITKHDHSDITVKVLSLVNNARPHYWLIITNQMTRHFITHAKSCIIRLDDKYKISMSNNSQYCIILFSFCVTVVLPNTDISWIYGILVFDNFTYSITLDDNTLLLRSLNNLHVENFDTKFLKIRLSYLFGKTLNISTRCRNVSQKSIVSECRLNCA